MPLLLVAAIGSWDTTAAAALGVLVVLPPVVLIGLAGPVLAGRVLARRSDAAIGLGRL